MAFIPSKYQADILHDAQFGTGNIIVEAVAGSGKTTTLEQMLKVLSGRKTAMFAFNKHIVTELVSRVTNPRVSIATIHSFGMATLRNAIYGASKGKVKGLKVDEGKYRTLSQGYIGMTLSPEERHRSMVDEKFLALLKAREAALIKLVGFVRMTLTDPRDMAGLDALIARYDITLDPKDEDGEEHIKKGVFTVIKQGMAQYRERGSIDFTDMIFLPYALDLSPEKFERILVDEAQDLNAAQRWLVKSACAPGARMFFVGDSKQAIMGFAGADTESFYKIQEETGAVSKPLSICYRSPARHLDLARIIVPQIEARDNAPAGEISAIHDMSAVEAVRKAYETSKDGVLVLSRTTAPLVGLCIRLIKGRIAARVRGRDIAQGLIEVAQSAGKLAPDFLDGLELYQTKQIDKLSKKEGNESRIEVLNDKCEALRVCYTEFADVNSVPALVAAINSIFSDEKPAVWLSTIHRAKGLEAETVFILNPRKLPFSHPKQGPEDMVQETNLLYVALTRSTRSLIFVHADSEELPKDGDDRDNLSI